MKKILLLSLTLLITGNLIIAQELGYSQKLIKKIHKAKSASVNPDAHTSNHLWLTPLLVQAVTSNEILDEKVMNLLSPLEGRPELPNEQIGFSEYFDFHYTLTGEWAVDPTDENNNGVPDFVENMALIFDEVYSKNLQQGYTVPPGDNGAGGSDFYDIYIGGPEFVTYGLYGFVAPETKVGDNPNSPDITETEAYSSWMGMNYDYSWAEDPEKAVAVTAAHEFLHAVQMGYNTEMGVWIMEMTAAWIEDVHFPGYDDNLQYLTGVFGTPDIALNLDDDDDDNGLGNHWYSTWIFTQYMSEQTGDVIVKNIFERTVTDWDLVAIDNELQANWDTDFETMFSQYLIANIVLSNDAQYSPFNYSRAEVYENYIDENGGVNVEGSIVYDGSPVTYNSDTDGNGRLMRLSADYIALQPNGNFKVTLTPENFEDEIDFSLLKLNSNTETLMIQPSVEVGNTYEISIGDFADFDTYLLLVGRYDPAIEDTMAANYSISVDISSSIQTNMQSNLISIGPNPTTDYITITNANSNNDFDIKIISLSGKVVYAKKHLLNNSRVSLADFKSGEYVIQINIEGNTLFKKIIKK
ncbi:MAG: T9SS type A sorting domain-containing protein [Bacteroidota bacterium]